MEADMIIDDIGMETPDGELEEAMGNGESLEEQESEPTSIIVTNLQPHIFEEPHQKNIFELLFEDIDETATFQYFKSFRRVRVNFATPTQAAAARIKLHMTEFQGEVIKCYFTQPIVLGSKRDGPHLQPPKREKQFLISPPASPPVGWEPVEEAEPVINYDLIAAVASLAPGESHEIHPPMEDKPGIIVHICEEAENLDGPKPQIIQTRRPQPST
ncbi:calcipressin-1-like [Penaeus chinensis]|uniref:calcipressin-1-like n=1 Tax=Penaeus chinensis TaxID=139456 RepID=UPI001FB79D17|nr:calcipressin-1-like [Penaeus chinensis]